MAHATLDARYLLCPLPVIRCQDKASGMQVGDTLEVICTDPGALQDIPMWCRMHGHQVLESADLGDEVKIVLQIAAEK